MSTVRKIRIRPVLVPMVEPHRTASGVIEVSPLVLVDIETSDGVVGHSIVFTYTPAALLPCTMLLRNIGETLVGESIAPLDIHMVLHQRFRLLGTQGMVGMALAGIDMALWDALAREQELPLVTLLGGSPGPVQTYGAIGYDGETGSARTAEKLVCAGFRGVKAKIGYPELGQDIAVVRAIRDAVGGDVAIMVDYNQSLDPVEAVARIRALDSEGLVWVEEPVLAHDYTASASVRTQVKTPIQSGENWWGSLDLQHAIETDASTFVMPDVMKIGGVSGWLRASALAQSRQLPMSSHLWPELSAHLLRCTPTAHWLEFCDWWQAVLREPAVQEDGMVLVDNRPGSGMEWNEESIKEYSVN